MNLNVHERDKRRRFLCPAHHQRGDPRLAVLHVGEIEEQFSGLGERDADAWVFGHHGASAARIYGDEARE